MVKKKELYAGDGATISAIALPPGFSGFEMAITSCDRVPLSMLQWYRVIENIEIIDVRNRAKSKQTGGRIMNRVRLIKDIVKWYQGYDWPDWRITETLIGVLEFNPKDIEKAGYGYLIEEYFADEEE